MASKSGPEADIINSYGKWRRQIWGSCFESSHPRLPEHHPESAGVGLRAAAVQVVVVVSVAAVGNLPRTRREVSPVQVRSSPEGQQNEDSWCEN